MIDILNILVTAVIGLTTFYLVRFYYIVKCYPPGPMPLPLFGNMLLLKGTKRHASIEMFEMLRKYGSVATFWAGNTPLVFIFDVELGRNTFKRNEFAGRPKTITGSLISTDEYSGVAFDDFGHRFEALRRVEHMAVRKYAVTEKLANLVCECVEEGVNEMKSKESFNKAFDPFDYIYFIFANILLMSVTGTCLKMDDKKFKRVRYMFFDAQIEMGPKEQVMEFLPFMKIFYGSLLRKVKDEIDWNREWVTKDFREHYKDYNPNALRDLSDALIFAKNEAIAEGKESAPYLKDENLGMAILDLFFAGISTSYTTFKWMVLFLANYPYVQMKLRQEIEANIGDRMPVQEDRNKCHYINAFIFEIMRIRPIVPFGLFHKSLVQSTVGKYTILKDTTVFVHQQSILNDPNIWHKPEEFIPERFLDNDGKLTQTSSHAFMPFGTGRRACLGEKMAIADFFMALVRFLQLIKDISLENGANSADLEPNADIPDTFTPKQYKIIIKELKS